MPNFIHFYCNHVLANMFCSVEPNADVPNFIHLILFQLCSVEPNAHVPNFIHFYSISILYFYSIHTIIFFGILFYSKFIEMNVVLYLEFQWRSNLQMSERMRRHSRQCVVNTN